MKGIFRGILFIVLVGIAGLVYRNASEHPLQPIVCPLDTLRCPDGTLISRTGSSCIFSVCPAPNVSIIIGGVHVSFAVPAGFASVAPSDTMMLAAYEMADASSTKVARVSLRHYAIEASSTPSAVIQETAINASGVPAAVTAFSSSESDNRRYTVVSIERSGSSIDTAYYLVHGADLFRFDAIDTNVQNWYSPGLNVSALPAHAALKKLLSTLQML